MATIHVYDSYVSEKSFIGEVETHSGKVWGSQNLRESLLGMRISGRLGLEGHYTQENGKTLVYTVQTMNNRSLVGYVDDAGKLYSTSDRLLGRVDKEGYVYGVDEEGNIYKKNAGSRECQQLRLRVENDKGAFEDAREGLKIGQEEISAALLVKVTGAFAILCMGFRPSGIIQ